MKITVLSDNIGCEDLRGEWGLSFHIEFNGKGYLLDTGGSELFMANTGENCYAGLGFLSKYIGLPKGVPSAYRDRISCGLVIEL